MEAPMLLWGGQKEAPMLLWGGQKEAPMRKKLSTKLDHSRHINFVQ